MLRYIITDFCTDDGARALVLTVAEPRGGFASVYRIYTLQVHAQGTHCQERVKLGIEMVSSANPSTVMSGILTLPWDLWGMCQLVAGTC